MRLAHVFLLPCLALASGLAAAQDAVVLFDTETMRVVREGPLELTPTELAIVPSAVGVAGSQDECALGSEHWLTTRASSRATGAFTGLGAEETLVSVRFRRCDDLDTPVLPGALVLYGEDAAIDHVPGPLNVVAVQDVDRDGIDEVVVISREVGQGALVLYASLWAFDGGEARLLVDFDVVHADYCGSYMAGTEPLTHTRVTYTPTAGGEPDFERASRTGSCAFR